MHLNHRTLAPLLLLLLVTFFPAPAHAAQRPFPQHSTYTDDTIRPTGEQAILDQAVISFYDEWKTRYLRVGKPGQIYVFANPEKNDESPHTRAVSEGQGYGMLITVLMAGADPDAQKTFDALYHYFRAHPSKTHPDLMAWQQVYKNGSKTPERIDANWNAATDGDLDIALSLLMADRQWGSEGEINYKAEGEKVLKAILDAQSTGKMLKLGSWVGDKGKYAGAIRTSDFVPAHFRTFLDHSGDERWKAIHQHTQAALDHLFATYSPKTALFPDFAVLKDGKYQPAPAKFLEGPNDGHYFYNACRIPWRLTTHYLLSGDPAVLALLEPINAWVREATGNDPQKINAGYRLDGKPLDEDRSAAFLAPLAVAAMIDATAGNQEWLDALWKTLIERPASEDAYYGNTLKLLALIVLSGNWWQ